MNGYWEFSDWKWINVFEDTVSSRAQPEKGHFFPPVGLNGLRWREAWAGDNSESTWAQRNTSWEIEGPFQFSSESCVSFPDLGSRGNRTCLPLQGCWASKKRPTSCGDKGLLVLTRTAEELAVNNMLLSQKVGVWSHRQELGLFFFNDNQWGILERQPSLSHKLGNAFSEPTLGRNFLRSSTPKLSSRSKTSPCSLYRWPPQPLPPPPCLHEAHKGSEIVGSLGPFSVTWELLS